MLAHLKGQMDSGKVPGGAGNNALPSSSLKWIETDYAKSAWDKRAALKPEKERGDRMKTTTQVKALIVIGVTEALFIVDIERFLIVVRTPLLG